MLKLHIRDSARADLDEALAYYAAISPHLSEAFLMQLETAVSVLCEHPGIGSRRFAHLFKEIDLRTWSLDRFPFRLFYIIQDGTLHILRVDHERRNVTAEMLGQVHQ